MALTVVSQTATRKSFPFVQLTGQSSKRYFSAGIGLTHRRNLYMLVYAFSWVGAGID